MYRLMTSLARVTAVIGGIVLVALVVLTTVSILGRSLNDLLHTDTAATLLGGFAQTLIDMGVGEIRGNYELLEAGVAFAIFSFFPICQLHSAHATVDIFTSFLPNRLNRLIIAFWEFVLAAALILISWRLYEGMQRYIGNGETTFFLQFPVWWAYAASWSASFVTCIVAVYCVYLRLVELTSGRNVLPSELGH